MKKKFLLLVPIIMLIILNIAQSWFGSEILTYDILNNSIFYLFVVDTLILLLLLMIFIILLLQISFIYFISLFKNINSEKLSSKKKKIIYVIVCFIALYLSIIWPLHDIRAHINFKSHYSERMQVINNYKENNENYQKKEILTLPENFKKLSINEKIIIDNNEYFYFYVTEDTSNNHYFVYTENTTDKFYEEGRVVSLEKLAENWYYLKCEF